MVELDLEAVFPDSPAGALPQCLQPPTASGPGTAGAALMGMAQHWRSRSRPLQKGFSAVCSEGTCSHPDLPPLLREHLRLLSPTWLSWLCWCRTWSGS